jgi:hypothetical protein
MSLAADPNQTYEYVLESDRKMPVEKQPVFIFKYLTARKWKTLISCRDKIKAATTVMEITEQALEIIKLNLIGWKNVIAADGSNMEFSLEKIEDILSPDDIYELMTAENKQSLNSEDKKKLDSPSPSDTDSSAKDAPAQ